MKEIRISAGSQRVTLLALLAIGAALFVTQLPEIKRYLSIKTM